jgi:hypothetical protein
MRSNHGITILTAALMFVAFVCTAQAAVLDHIIAGPNNISDEDREYLIDNARSVDSLGNPLPVGSALTVGQIDVGDVFRGLINFNTLNSGGANLGGTTGENELTGVFQVLVTSKTVIPGVGFSFTFGPDPAFAEGGVPGAMVVLFEDPSVNFAADYNAPPPGVVPGGLVHDDGAPHGGVHTPPSSADVSIGPYADENAFIGTATNGTRFATFGFAGAPGEGFTAFSAVTDNVLTFFSFTTGSTLATANFSMSRLDGPGAETFDVITLGPVASLFAPFTIVGIAGSQNLQGVSDLDTSFEISTNADVAFNVVQVIPEPFSLAIWSLIAAVSVGYVAVRRKTARSVV